MPVAIVNRLRETLLLTSSGAGPSPAASTPSRRRAAIPTPRNSRRGSARAVFGALQRSFPRRRHVLHENWPPSERACTARSYIPSAYSGGTTKVAAIGRLQPVDESLRASADGSVEDDSIFAHIDEVRLPGGVVPRPRRAVAQTVGRNVDFEAARNQIDDRDVGHFRIDRAQRQFRHRPSIRSREEVTASPFSLSNSRNTSIRLLISVVGGARSKPASIS